MKLYRILGIDYGSVRIGLALSDPLRIIAKPYKVVINTGEPSFTEILDIIKKEHVGELVIGLPLHPDGAESEKTREVRAFAEKLAKDLAIPWSFWNETYTTVEANAELKKMKINSRDSKKYIDMVAASVILKDYLEYKK